MLSVIYSEYCVHVFLPKFYCGWLILRFLGVCEKKFHLQIIFYVFRRVRKMQKATITFVLSLSVLRMGQLGSHWTDFHEIWYWKFFEKFVENIKVSLKRDTNIIGTLHEHLYTSCIIYLPFLLRMRSVSEKFVEKMKKHFTFNKFFFPKIIPFMSHCVKM